MDLQKYLFDVKQHLIDCVQSYIKLLNISVVIECKDFVNQDICFKIFKDGFLHLTILPNNHLDHTKPIYLVKPFLSLA